MGVGGISIWQLLIILLIVLLLFGAKRLRTLGTDVGEALKGFRKAVRDGDHEEHGPKNIEHGSAENLFEDEVRDPAKKKT